MKSCTHLGATAFSLRTGRHLWTQLLSDLLTCVQLDPWNRRPRWMSPYLTNDVLGLWCLSGQIKASLSRLDLDLGKAGEHFLSYVATNGTWLSTLCNCSLQSGTTQDAFKTAITNASPRVSSGNRAAVFWVQWQASGNRRWLKHVYMYR